MTLFIHSMKYLYFYMNFFIVKSTKKANLTDTNEMTRWKIQKK